MGRATKSRQHRCQIVTTFAARKYLCPADNGAGGIGAVDPPTGDSRRSMGCTWSSCGGDLPPFTSPADQSQEARDTLIRLISHIFLDRPTPAWKPFWEAFVSSSDLVKGEKDLPFGPGDRCLLVASIQSMERSLRSSEGALPGD
jgi:hypothetical protein